MGTIFPLWAVLVQIPALPEPAPGKSHAHMGEVCNLRELELEAIVQLCVSRVQDCTLTCRGPRDSGELLKEIATYLAAATEHFQEPEESSQALDIWGPEAMVAKSIDQAVEEAAQRPACLDVCAKMICHFLTGDPGESDEVHEWDHDAVDGSSFTETERRPGDSSSSHSSPDDQDPACGPVRREDEDGEDASGAGDEQKPKKRRRNVNGSTRARRRKMRAREEAAQMEALFVAIAEEEAAGWQPTVTITNSLRNRLLYMVLDFVHR